MGQTSEQQNNSKLYREAKVDADKIMKQISFVWKTDTAEALNQSDLHCIQSIHLIMFMGIQPITVMILDY